MATPTLDHQVIDLTDADEFDVLSLTLPSANALELADEAIDHLRRAATANTDATRGRLRVAIRSLDHTRLLLSTMLDDLHQGTLSDHHAAPTSHEFTA